MFWYLYVEIWRRFLITWPGRILFLSNFVLEILLTIVSHVSHQYYLPKKKRQPHITYNKNIDK